LGEDDKRALVETSNAKGHSVKTGNLIGENFGIIESIESSKIVILEKKL
jgi:Tfp pilus assembly protein PilP